MYGRSGSRITGLIVGLTLVGAILGWTWYQRGEYEDQARADLTAAIASLDEYADNRALLDPIVERAHESAFDAAYRWQLPAKRRSRRQSFNEETYRQHAYTQITSALEAAGREDLAVKVERLRARQ